MVALAVPPSKDICPPEATDVLATAPPELRINVPPLDKAVPIAVPPLAITKDTPEDTTSPDTTMPDATTSAAPASSSPSVTVPPNSTRLPPLETVTPLMRPPA